LKREGSLQKASKIVSILLLSLLLASIGVAVYADTQVLVYIRNPLNSSNGARATGWEKYQ